MQHNITTSLFVCLSDEGFGLDELVCRMDDLFNQKAFPELLGIILGLVNENLRLRVMQRQPLPGKCACACGKSDLVLNGTIPRNIRTRLGVVSLTNVTRVKCKGCGKTFVPLLLMCGLEKHQTMSSEFEKLVLETCATETYRVAARTLHATTAATESHTTYHRWFLKTKADEITVGDDVMGSMPGVLFADGTKCKGVDGNGHACKGDIKVLLGVNSRGEVIPLGTWTHRETWRQISEEMKRREVHFPDGTIVVCDGEIGLAEAMAGLANGEQRCQWHVSRDLYHMMRRDGGTIKEVRPMQQRLRGIMGIELPRESFEGVSDEDKESIRQRMETSERELEKLIGEIRKDGYVAAGDYLDRAKHAMFGYVRRWLALGIVCPRASSFIERTMRAIGRRIKKLGYNWKESGVGKMARVVLKLFASRNEWEAYWKERMDLNQSVMLSFKALQVQ